MVFRSAHNTTTTVDIVHEPTTPPTNGCTFEVIRPAVSFRCDTPTVIDCTNQGDLYTDETFSWSGTQSRLLLCNMEWDFSSLTTPGPLTVTGNGTDAGVRLPFMRFAFNDVTQFYPAIIENCSINGQVAKDAGAEAASGVVAVNLGVAEGGVGTQFDAPDGFFWFRGNCAHCFDLAVTNIVANSMFGEMFYFSSKSVYWSLGVSFAQRFCIYGKSDVDAGQYLYTDHCYIDEGSYAFRVGNQATLVPRDTVCSITGVTGYAVEVNSGTVQLLGACPNLIGAAGAYKFTGVNPVKTSATWPTVGTADADGLGSVISYPVE